MCVLYTATGGNYVPIFKDDDNILSNTNSLYLNVTNRGVLMPELRFREKSSIKTSKMSASISDEPFLFLELTHKLEEKIKSIRNTELGITSIQKIFDTMEFVSIQRNDTKLVADMAKRLSLKLSKAIQVINETISQITQRISMDPSIYLHTFVYPCAYDELNQHYDRTQIEIKNYQKRKQQVVPTNKNITVNDQLMNIIKSINYTSNNFRQVFFLSHFDSASPSQCCIPIADDHFR